MKKSTILFFLFFSFCSFAQNAQDIIDGLKKDLKSKPDLKRTAIIYSDLNWYYSNISIDSSMFYGKMALTESLKVGDSTLIAQVYSDIGTVYLKNGELNQAINSYNESLTIRIKKNDLQGIAKGYFRLGDVYSTQTKYKLAMKNYLLALDYANKINNGEIEINIKNNMSSLLLDLKDYKKALKYSNEAISYIEKKKAFNQLCSMYTNKGNILLGMNDTINAIKFYEKAKIICNETGNKLGLSKVLNNIGIVKEAQKKYDESKKLFNTSKQKREELNSDVLLNKLQFSEIDELIRTRKFSDSKNKLLKLKAYFQKKEDNDNLLNTYKMLVPVCSNINEHDSVSSYQEKYLELNKYIYENNVSKQIIELETKYQTAKKEKQLLQNEIEAKKRNYIILGLFLLSVFVALIGFLIYRQQKLKNKQQTQAFELKQAISQIETQNKLQHQRLAISKDLHDNIGAQLTFIISSVETAKFAPEIENTKLGSKLTKISDFTKDTIVELRDTIWAMNSNEIGFDDLRSRILNFIEKANTASESVSFKFTIDANLNAKKVSSITGMNMYRTIQEALNNALKYAKATEVLVDINEIDGKIAIKIIDNGKGFEKNDTILGNGLNNMQKRIEEIGGTFNLTSEVGKGTKISILI